jgi:hypothetical protein
MANKCCFRIHFCVPPEYEFLVAELHFEGEHFGELNTESGRLDLVLYPRASGQPWAMPLQDAIASLQEAQAELVSRSTFFGE